MVSRDNALEALSEIIKSDPVDWQSFDAILSSIEDINALDEENEETLLTEFLQEADFYHNGSQMPEAVRHFLKNGYDVKAHEGRNGGIVLSWLCWTSYDKYILDTAKALLDAGAPLEYKSVDDDPDDELSGVRSALGFKLPAAWAVDKDYIWANILEAYYSITDAVIKGKDYHQITSYLECVGKTVTGASVITSGNGSAVTSDDDTYSFTGFVVLWFDKAPLVIRKYIDFAVDPVTVEEHAEMLIDAGSIFAPVIGSTLTGVQYINQSTCFFDFDNGVRIVFIHLKGDDAGSFAFTAVKTIGLEGLEVDKVVPTDWRYYG